MNIYMKIIIMLLILGILIPGCISKSEDHKEDKDGVDAAIKEKERLNKEDWYMSIYEGPSDIENSENARMSIVPHLRELGWDGGMNVAYGTDRSDNHSIILALPFKLTDKSMDYINQTLSNFSFMPIKLNEKIINDEIINE